MPSTGKTIEVSTFGWMFQYTSSTEYGPYSKWAGKRCDKATELFNKRAVDGVLPYVVATHEDNGAPDKRYPYEVRKNCPLAFFVEAWGEHQDGANAYGELVGYLRHHGGRWQFVTTYTLTHIDTVPVRMGNGVVVNIPLRRIIYNIEDGMPHATYILAGGYSVELSGSGTGEGYQVHLEEKHFNEWPDMVKELHRLKKVKLDEQVAAKAQEAKERAEADLKRKMIEYKRQWQKTYDEAVAAKQKATALMLEYEEKLAEADRLHNKTTSLPPLPAGKEVVA